MKKAMNGEHITRLTSPDTASGIAGAKAMSRTRSRCNISHLCSWRRGFGNGYVLEVMYPTFSRLGKLDRTSKATWTYEERRKERCSIQGRVVDRDDPNYRLSGCSLRCVCSCKSDLPQYKARYSLGNGRLGLHKCKFQRGPGFQPQRRRKLTRRR